MLNITDLLFATLFIVILFFTRFFWDRYQQRQKRIEHLRKIKLKFLESDEFNLKAYFADEAILYRLDEHQEFREVVAYILAKARRIPKEDRSQWYLFVHLRRRLGDESTGAEDQTHGA